MVALVVVPAGWRIDPLSEAQEAELLRVWHVLQNTKREDDKLVVMTPKLYQQRPLDVEAILDEIWRHRGEYAAHILLVPRDWWVNGYVVARAARQTIPILALAADGATFERLVPPVESVRIG